MTYDLQPLFDKVDASFDDTLDRLKQFLRYPSISTDPAYASEARACAEWMADALRSIGMEASVRDTAGHPIVVGHDRTGPADAPHLLYYGHYDVQPPEPLELWRSPPFEPVIEDGPRGRRVTARGAVDDKGQILTWLTALRVWKEAHGRLPVRVSVIVEGEEEISSPSLPPFLERTGDELRADICVISDTLMLEADRPALTISMRGLVYAEVTVQGPGRDLHSGTFGGTVVNPIHVLARMLGDLHDEQGRVRIPGFYDDVGEPPPEVGEFFRQMNFDEAAFYRSAGVPEGRGEAGRALVERMWSRPCCDVNGIWGGYTGVGRKTVIPSVASAKISCRLVADQNPDAVLEGLRRFFAERTPADCQVTVTSLGSSPPVRVRHDSRFVAAARAALTTAFGAPPAMKGGAGTLPLISDFRNILGMDCLLMGFGLDDDCVHGPNEKFELVCLRQGIRSHLALLAQLSEEAAASGI